ncbi:hypothetical protein DL95DRAFT_469591 [Leptodontidium sp. 2 PMI_412]|nr:hypothetical protein DL95DRAFT_469591 [Leptodontidium sp. 2 PMI_412]
MDHIPRPYNAVGTAIEFPCVRVEEYDKGPFLTYPNRKGFESQDAILQESDTPASQAAVLQTWLFFGLLHEFLEEDYTNDKDWTSVNDAQEIVLCTKNLAVATKSHWDARQEKEERSRHLLACFGRAFQVVSLACELPAADTQVLMGVAILVNFLSGTILPLSGSFEAIPSGNWSGYSWPGILVDPIKERLRSHGWCPSEMISISENLDMILASVQLEPPNPHYQHAECNEKSCRILEVYSNMKTYPEPGHVADGRECPWFELDVNKAHDILLGGNLPVILVANDGEIWKSRLGLSNPAKLNVAIKSSNEVRQYIAFSHVWSDGLGNPHSNRLRVCKLDQLQTLASGIEHARATHRIGSGALKVSYVSLSKPLIPFWIDTICCPTHPPEAQTLGIKMLQQTYKEASSVIVLDSYLQRAVFWKTSKQEILLRVECSRWMHRLWTLQEGSLANELFLQFSDGPVDYFAVYNRFKEVVDAGDTVARNLHINFTLTSSVFNRNLFRPEVSSKIASQAIYRAMQYRSTTVKSDEAICIANTLSLDIEQVLQAGKDSQLAMSVIWKLLPYVDSCIIFSTTPKLKISGFGWAPETFLDPDGFQESRTEAGTVTEAGLEVRFPGFLINLENQISGKLAFKDQENKSYTYQSSTTVDGWSQGAGMFAIIALRPLVSESGGKATQRCVVARVKKRDESLIAVELVDHGRGRDTQVEEARATMKRSTDLAEGVFSATKLPINQLWCVN